MLIHNDYQIKLFTALSLMSRYFQSAEGESMTDRQRNNEQSEHVIPASLLIRASSSRPLQHKKQLSQKAGNVPARIVRHVRASSPLSRHTRGSAAEPGARINASPSIITLRYRDIMHELGSCLICT